MRNALRNALRDFKEPSELVPSDPDTRARTRRLFDAHRSEVFVRTDRLFVVLLAVQWLFGIILAITMSPRTWSGGVHSTHPHVFTALIFGGCISFYPIYLAFRHAGRRHTRMTIAAAQMLWSALLIHLSGGRIETHFHVFGSLAFLAFYRDWQVFIPATIVVALDHLVRGIFWPESVYGVLQATPLRTIEHAAWVLFENVFLIYSCRIGTREMWQIALQRAELETTNANIEGIVECRTRDLATSQAEAASYAESLESANAELKQHQAELERINVILEEASGQAEAASNAKSFFLAHMSHELRTPMTAILGFSELLIDSETSPSERVNAAYTIRRNGEHLLDLINDLLDLSKIEAGKVELESLDVNPLDVVRDVIELLAERAAKKNLDLRTEIYRPIPRIIRTDPTRLRQALVNLVGNAIKFSGDGEVIIRLDCDPADEKLTISVVDFGMGITPAQMESLFQPFSQADISMSRRFGGTGLGLVITRNLAELLGGKVRVESVPGAGSTFHLTIATGDLSNAEFSDRFGPRSAEQVPTDFQPDSNLSGKILLVEDGVDNRRLLTFLLRGAGADVHVAQDGEEGVQMARNAWKSDAPYSLILMDMQMPVMDGYAATAALRAQGYTLPIVALTAHAMKGEAARCRSAGCDDYLSKPVHRPTFISTVARWMRAGSVKSESQTAAI